jgi:NitT/TauT family transport system substrate-binding protein
VLGGPSTFNVVWAAAAFVEANPTIHAAFTAALGEAVAAIAGDPAAAAQPYTRLSRDGSDVGLIAAILASPQVAVTTTPQATQRTVDFMARTKAIRRGAKDWRELFFADVHAKPGN